MLFPPLIHVALTVADLERSISWYCALFGQPPTLQQDEGAFLSAVWLQPLFGIHQHVDAVEASFDERQPGLDHVAFAVDTREELEGWVVRLDELGITRGDIVDAWYGSGLSFRDDDGIALEFFCSARPH